MAHSYKIVWSDERYEDFCKTENSDEYMDRLRQLVRILKEEGKINKNISENMILDAGSSRRHRFKEEGAEHKRLNALTRMSPEDQEEFLKDMESMDNIELLQKYRKKYPKLTIHGIKSIVYVIAGGRKKKIKKEKETNVFDAIPALKERLAELIREGMLVKKGFDHVHSVLSEEFKDTLQENGLTLTKRAMEDKIPEIIWTPEALKLMKEVAKSHEPVDVFLGYSPNTPAHIARSKLKELTGVSSKRKPIRFVPGIGRIASAIEDISTRRFRLPKNSFDRPRKVPAEGRWTISFLNGVNLGIPYGGVIEDNPALRALEDAEAKGDVVVIITNLLDIDTKKAAGPAKAGRALASGRNINTENFDAEYAKKVAEMLKNSSRTGNVYQTVEELFVDSMYGWRKIAAPDNKPIYSGEVLIVLGRKEEDVIFSAAYWEARYHTLVKQDKLRVKLAIAREALAVAESENNEEKIEQLIKRIQALQDEHARTIVSNIHPEDFKRYLKQVLAFIVKSLEETIPNSCVIGMGTTYVRVGDELIEICIPDHERVDDTLLANYNRVYGPKVLREKMASTVVICHPYALNDRSTRRENSRDGERGSSKVLVAPITVDEEFLREVSSGVVRPIHPIFKAVKNEQFQAGLLRLECISGVVSSRTLSIETLRSRSKSSEGSTRKKTDIKFIWIMAVTDPHMGSGTREQFEVGDGVKRGATEAVIWMMRKEGLCKGARMPVHMVVMPDDPVQGHHFPTEQQPHEEVMSYPAIEKHVQMFVEEVMRTNDIEKARHIVRKTRNFFLDQLLRRGEIWTQSQVLWFMKQVIELNLDFFNSVLMRGIKANLKVRGVSEFKKVPYDSRDIGLIIIGTGNHFFRSTGGEMTEGVIYANQLRNLLRTIPRWRNQGELLEKLVRAPLYGNICVGYGTVQAPGGYEWGIDVRSSPPNKGTRWEDPLMNYVRVDMRRGNPSMIMNKRKTIKIVGDKHFFATVNTPYALYHMSAPDTPTDVFAEWAGGFPPNNTGVSFIGIPANGPDSGPIIIRELSFEHIRDYFLKDQSFDWKAFLPNPV